MPPCRLVRDWLRRTTRWARWVRKKAPDRQKSGTPQPLRMARAFQISHRPTAVEMMRKSPARCMHLGNHHIVLKLMTLLFDHVITSCVDHHHERVLYGKGCTKREARESKAYAYPSLLRILSVSPHSRTLTGWSPPRCFESHFSFFFGFFFTLRYGRCMGLLQRMTTVRPSHLQCTHTGTRLFVPGGGAARQPNTGPTRGAGPQLCPLLLPF